MNNEIFCANMISGAGAVLMGGGLLAGIYQHNMVLAGIGVMSGLGLSIMGSQQLNSASMDWQDLMQQRNALHLREQFGEKQGAAMAGLQAAEQGSWADRTSAVSDPLGIGF